MKLPLPRTGRVAPLLTDTLRWRAAPECGPRARPLSTGPLACTTFPQARVNYTPANVAAGFYGFLLMMFTHMRIEHMPVFADLHRSGFKAYTSHCSTIYVCDSLKISVQMRFLGQHIECEWLSKLDPSRVSKV